MCVSVCVSLCVSLCLSVPVSVFVRWQLHDCRGSCHLCLSLSLRLYLCFLVFVQEITAKDRALVSEHFDHESAKKLKEQKDREVERLRKLLKQQVTYFWRCGCLYVRVVDTHS